MENLKLNHFGVEELTSIEELDINGGAFPWGLFWRGLGIGASAGAVGAGTYYAVKYVC